MSLGKIEEEAGDPAGHLPKDEVLDAGIGLL